MNQRNISSFQKLLLIIGLVREFIMCS